MGRKGMMNRLRRADRILGRFEGWVILAVLAVMVLFTALEVCLRGLYTHGGVHWANTLLGHLDWSGGFVRLLVLWVTMVGASLLTSEHRHVSIDMMTPLLPLRARAVRDLVLSAASVVISAIMLKVCISYVTLEMEFGGPEILGLPGWIGQAILPAGFASILFRHVVRLLDRTISPDGGARQ